jgi:hypothetical protein
VTDRSGVVAQQSRCPGCGLEMPGRDGLRYDGYYHVSPECWSVYTEVLAAEYSNAPLFGRVHQLTVDAYAAQHAGGIHKPKSVAVHLSGLFLVYERNVRPAFVAPMLQQLATAVTEWPHFEPPPVPWQRTIFDVALCDTSQAHAETVTAWSLEVWHAWTHVHATIRELVLGHIAVV